MQTATYNSLPTRPRVEVVSIDGYTARVRSLSDAASGEGFEVPVANLSSFEGEREAEAGEVVSLNRNVLVATLNLAATGQHTRAEGCERNGQTDKASDLRGNAEALRELGVRVQAGEVADVSISGALERILTS